MSPGDHAQGDTTGDDHRRDRDVAGDVDAMGDDHSDGIDNPGEPREVDPCAQIVLRRCRHVCSPFFVGVQ